MRIIKRQKGRKNYFYLQHSFRKGKKVITKEKYLGLEIPKNIEEITAEFRTQFRKELYNQLQKIKNNFQTYWEKLSPSIQERELHELAIAFTYNTNAIEGSKITLEETREIIDKTISPHKPLRDVLETESHSKAFLQMLAQKEKIDQHLILSWHQEIFKDTKEDIAGRYRDQLVTIAGYLPPDPEKIHTLMNELIHFITQSYLNHVELAARAHYRFEKIHPFGDGNGRIGRLLMNCILWQAHYPLLIIENKRKKSYYKALQKDEECFVNYFLRSYLLVHKKRLKGN